MLAKDPGMTIQCHRNEQLGEWDILLRENYLPQFQSFTFSSSWYHFVLPIKWTHRVGHFGKVVTAKGSPHTHTLIGIQSLHSQPFCIFLQLKESLDKCIGNCHKIASILERKIFTFIMVNPWNGSLLHDLIFFEVTPLNCVYSQYWFRDPLYRVCPVKVKMTYE